jgi:hypothetical protein
MKKLDCQAVLRSYVDPLRKEAGEWGAFTGLHGADRAVGLEQIRMLSGTALARAGFSVSTRLDSARARLASIESNQNGMREELQAAWRKLIGSQPFDCTRMHRVIVEAVLEMFAIPGLIMALLASKPFMAWRRRRLERIERDDGMSIELRRAAEDLLIVEFEWHYSKGQEARRHRAGPALRVPTAGERAKEDRHERSARAARP